MDTKKGVPLYSNLVNLKSNTMKNTLQRYDFCLTFASVFLHLYFFFFTFLIYINRYNSSYYRLLCIFCHYESLLFHSVHHHAKRMFKANMSYVGCFFHGRHLVENFLVKESHAFVFVYCEISHSEAGEVLEEVCALARIHAVVLERNLYDYLCSADMWPFYGHAEPRIA